MSNRTKVEALWIKAIDSYEGGTVSTTILKDILKDMSDKMFEALMADFRDGNQFPFIMEPPGGEVKLSPEKGQAACKKAGINLYQRVKYTDAVTGDVILTPDEHMCYMLSVRRQNQHWEKKNSIPEGDTTIDHVTGQVTGTDKGSRLSIPEVQILEAKGLKKSILEMIKVNGGDREASQSMKKSIRETGGFALEPIIEAGTKPTVTKSLKAYLFAMGLDNTVGKQ